VLSITTINLSEVSEISILRQWLGFDEISLLSISQLTYQSSDNVVSLSQKLLETSVEVVFVEEISRSETFSEGVLEFIAKRGVFDSLCIDACLKLENFLRGVLGA
jgi:hypothetical protein